MALQAARAAGIDDPLLTMGGDLRAATGGDALETLATRLQAACLAAIRTVALAESCTGGLVAATLTSIAGSSAYFLGGVVSYANEAKRDLLGIDPAVLAAHGAVSAQVARSMATGVRERLGADVGAAVTGIAGPDGGTDEKPVGLTYIAVADAAGVDVRRVVWPGDRTANRIDSAHLMLEMLLARVASEEPVTVGARPGHEAG